MVKKTNPRNIISLMMPFIFLLTLTGCSALQSDSHKKTRASEGFSFIYMSDSQADPETGDYSAWGQMLQLAAADESRPDFVMIGGDLINDGNDQAEWDAFFAAGGAALKKLALYPAAGNHDSAQLYESIFDLPDNGPAGKKNTFYSFDYGAAHFTVMDSNAMGAANQEDIDWLQKDLFATDRKYKIVMFHHPAYPAVAIPKDLERAKTIQTNFVPIMEEAGVNLVLSGHQHVYSRTYPLRNGKRDENGIVYLTSSSGGKRYNPGTFDYMACSSGKAPVYSIISVGKNGITIETRDAAGTVVDSTKGSALTEEQKKMTITVSGTGLAAKKVFTYGELAAQPNSGFQHVYSTINNWPTARFYAARGITVRSILKAAGVLDTARVITFRSPDSYEVSLTREQLLEIPRYYYPRVKEGTAEQAEVVEPIIAYEYKEGSDDMSAAAVNTPCLIFGQSNPGEHTNPAFVVDVAEIIVSGEEAEAWEPATTFPAAGKIAAGELVKLQHKHYGLVKLHYTLDGTEPTPLSPMYNISAYQPELNVPIAINRDTVIKVLVTGYGKKDSSISSFCFDVQ